MNIVLYVIFDDFSNKNPVDVIVSEYCIISIRLSKICTVVSEVATVAGTPVYIDNNNIYERSACKRFCDYTFSLYLYKMKYPVLPGLY